MYSSIAPPSSRRQLLIGSLAIALACVAAPLLAQESAPDTDETGWVDLFNGKNLDGWVQRGGKAEYAVVDGMIVGTSKPKTPNAFLCTTKNYGNFVLEYEMKGHLELNSGVQIRSQAFDKDTKVDVGGKTVDIKAGIVHGYQVEFDINQPQRVWTGGIYDESRRQWLYPGLLGGDKEKFAEQGRNLVHREDWNKFRVECRGPSIKTWLNGELRADLNDDMTPEGFIALQVHSDGGLGKPMTISWRNLRIQDLDAK
jgi:hypothetical protein